MAKHIFRKSCSSILIFFNISYGLFACSSGGNSSSGNNAINYTSNQTALTIDRGYTNTAWNRPFITITLCTPGSVTNCQTIDHIMVDSGSTGLRINQSMLDNALNLPIVQQFGSDVYSCMQFGAGYDFGKMVTADLYVGGANPIVNGESAPNLPVQIIDDSSSQSSVGDMACSHEGAIMFANLNAFGAKGIMGVNVIDHPDSSYTDLYTCDGNNCNPITLESMNVNPVSLFATNNNGLIFTLPEVAGATTATITGSLTFGLNTSANNQVPTTANRVLGGTIVGNPFWGAFIADEAPSMFDSGTPLVENPIDHSIPICLSGEFYCPNEPLKWSTSYSDYNQESVARGIITTTIITPPNNINNYSAIPGLTTDDSETMIWGLPYFFGNSIYLELASATVKPLGAAPAWGFLH